MLCYFGMAGGRFFWRKLEQPVKRIFHRPRRPPGEPFAAQAVVNSGDRDFTFSCRAESDPPPLPVTWWGVKAWQVQKPPGPFARCGRTNHFIPLKRVKPHRSLPKCWAKTSGRVLPHFSLIAAPGVIRHEAGTNHQLQRPTGTPTPVGCPAPAYERVGVKVKFRPTCWLPCGSSSYYLIFQRGGCDARALGCAAAGPKPPI